MEEGKKLIRLSLRHDIIQALTLLIPVLFMFHILKSIINDVSLELSFFIAAILTSLLFNFLSFKFWRVTVSNGVVLFNNLFKKKSYRCTSITVHKTFFSPFIYKCSVAGRHYYFEPRYQGSLLKLLNTDAQRDKLRSQITNV